LLNLESDLFDHFIQLPEVWLYVNEYGDGVEGFQKEYLYTEPVVADNDVVYIKMNHLTAVGLGVKEMPDSEYANWVDDSSERHFNCFLEVIMR